MSNNNQPPLTQPITITENYQEVPAIHTTLFNTYSWAPIVGGNPQTSQIPIKLNFNDPEVHLLLKNSERWWTLCDNQTPNNCLTAYSPDIPQATIFSNKNISSYMAAIDKFTLKPGQSRSYRLYLFPYNYSKIIDSNGTTIRDVIKNLRDSGQ